MPRSANVEVRLDADTRRFQSNLRGARAPLRGLTQELRKQQRQFDRATRGGRQFTGSLSRVRRSAFEAQQQVRRLQTQVARLDRQFKSMSANSGTTAGGFRAIHAGALLAVAGVARLGRELIDVAASFEQTEIRLQSLAGRNAGAVFDRILDFGATTPFRTQEIADTVILLENLNFDIINRLETALPAIGDAAIATGSSFGELGMAIASAARGSTEVLARFGIIARKEGDTITATYGKIGEEITETLSTAPVEILKLIERASAASFQGLTQAASNSLAGALGQLGDAVQIFIANIARAGQGGAGATLTGIVREVSAFVNSLELESLRIGRAISNALSVVRDVAILVSDNLGLVASGLAALYFAPKLLRSGIVAAFDEVVLSAKNVRREVAALRTTMIEQGQAASRNTRLLNNTVFAYNRTADATKALQGDILASTDAYNAARIELAKHPRTLSAVAAGMRGLAAAARTALSAIAAFGKTLVRFFAVGAIIFVAFELLGRFYEALTSSSEAAQKLQDELEELDLRFDALAEDGGGLDETNIQISRLETQLVGLQKQLIEARINASIFDKALAFFGQGSLADFEERIELIRSQLVLLRNLASEQLGTLIAEETGTPDPARRPRTADPAGSGTATPAESAADRRRRLEREAREEIERLGTLTSGGPDTLGIRRSTRGELDLVEGRVAGALSRSNRRVAEEQLFNQGAGFGEFEGGAPLSDFDRFLQRSQAELKTFGDEMRDFLNLSQDEFKELADIIEKDVGRSIGESIREAESFGDVLDNLGDLAVKLAASLAIQAFAPNNDLVRGIGQGLGLPGIPGLQTGGIAREGRPYRVHDGEIVVPRSDSYVLARPRVQQILAGGGGQVTNVNFTFNGNVDEEGVRAAGRQAATEFLYRDQMRRDRNEPGAFS